MARKKVTIVSVRTHKEKKFYGTLESLRSIFSYTLACGAHYQKDSEKKKINRKPRTTESLITNLNRASKIMSLNGYAKVVYAFGGLD